MTYVFNHNFIIMFVLKKKMKKSCKKIFYEKIKIETQKIPINLILSVEVSGRTCFQRPPV